jgi:para-nitrobenzyl esterase
VARRTSITSTPNPLSPNGAGHAAEIPYVFRTLGSSPARRRFVGATRPEDRAMSDLMSSYWVNFAKTGDPNGPGCRRGLRSPSRAGRDAFRRDVERAARRPNMTQIRTLDDYFAWRREQAKKTSSVHASGFSLLSSCAFARLTA